MATPFAPERRRARRQPPIIRDPSCNIRVNPRAPSRNQARGRTIVYTPEARKSRGSLASDRVQTMSYIGGPYKHRPGDVVKEFGLRHAVRTGLRRMGIEVHWHRDAGGSRTRIAPAATLPRLFDDPVDALQYIHGGKPASFPCPIDRCVDVNGLSLDSWHPFVATLTEYAEGAITGYDGSSLQRYYEAWQPRNAWEAFVMSPRADGGCLSDLPSYLVHLFPWRAIATSEADHDMKRVYHKDHVEHGCSHFAIDHHGSRFHGPVTERVGKLEFARLERVYHSLSSRGYNRECGDIRVIVVRRGGEYRAIHAGGGVHRAAALKALGYRSVPATFSIPAIMDIADVAR